MAVAAVVAAVAVLVVDLADARVAEALVVEPVGAPAAWAVAAAGSERVDEAREVVSAQAAERDETPRALDAVAAGQVQRIEARVVSEPVPRAAAQAGGTLEALAQKAQVVIDTPRPIAAN